MCGEDECSFGVRSLLLTVLIVLGEATLACGDTTCSRPSRPGLQRIFHFADLVACSSLLERGGVPADSSTGSCNPRRSDKREPERAGIGGVEGNSLSLPLARVGVWKRAGASGRTVAGKPGPLKAGLRVGLPGDGRRSLIAETGTTGYLT